MESVRCKHILEYMLDCVFYYDLALVKLRMLLYSIRDQLFEIESTRWRCINNLYTDRTSLYEDHLHSYIDCIAALNVLNCAELLD